MDKGFHFYAVSAAEWLAHEDVFKLIEKMDAAKYSYLLYYVPVSITMDYEISRDKHTPDVEGVVYLGMKESKR